MIKLLALLAALLISSVAAQVPNIPNQGGSPTATRYPLNSSPVAVSTTGADTSSATAALPAVSGRLNFVCGFNINGLGATALTNVTATLGSLGSSSGSNAQLNYAYQFPAGATVAATQLTVTYFMCMPGIASNTAVTLTVPGAAGNTSTNLNIWGYQLPTP